LSLIWFKVAALHVKVTTQHSLPQLMFQKKNVWYGHITFSCCITRDITNMCNPVICKPVRCSRSITNRM
jgi:hypothetical protein